jgi:hypothetical protein
MNKLILIASLGIFVFSLPASAQIIAPSCPAQQQDDQDGGFTVPENWRTKFPFDLVYPSSSPDTDIDEKCPQFVLWGYEYELCSIMQIAKAAKNIFLVKLSLDFLMKG